MRFHPRPMMPIEHSSINTQPAIHQLEKGTRNAVSSESECLFSPFTFPLTCKQNKKQSINRNKTKQKNKTTFHNASCHSLVRRRHHIEHSPHHAPHSSQEEKIIVIITTTTTSSSSIDSNNNNNNTIITTIIIIITRSAIQS